MDIYFNKEGDIRKRANFIYIEKVIIISFFFLRFKDGKSFLLQFDIVRLIS